MPQDQPFRSDPGHIGDFSRRSAADIFNDVILPTVNSVTQLLPPVDGEMDMDEEELTGSQFSVDKAFNRPEDNNPLAQMYRGPSQQPA